MATAATGTLQAQELTPSFTANDLQRSITFYEGLGFRPHGISLALRLD